MSDPDPVTAIAIRIDSPANGAVLTDPDKGTIAVSGEVSWTATGPPRDVDIKVQVWIGDNPCSVKVGVHLGQREKEWSAEGRVNKPGPFTITAKATHSSVPETTHQISVTVVDSAAPTIIIASPSQNSEPLIKDDGSSILELKVKADDAVGVQKVTWKLFIDNIVYNGEMTPEAGADWNWKADVALPPTALGSRSILVDCVDWLGVFAETKTLVFVGKDVTAPTLTIQGPTSGTKIPWSGDSTKITFSGTVEDKQTGVAAVTGKLLDKSRAVVAEDQQTFAPPGQPGTQPKQSWNIELPVPRDGWYSVEIRCRDHAGKESAATISNLEVAKAFSPTDINDLLGPRQYLEDLLDFVNVHIRRPKGPILQPTFP